MEVVTLTPMSAPAPRVQTSVPSATVSLALAPPKIGTEPGISFKASLAKVKAAAIRPAMPSIRALATPSAPDACSERSVSAQATPEGNRSRSWLMSLRFTGIAATTPTQHTAMSHTTVWPKLMAWPVVI
jgi:hypothetical protein